jgi:hypothetical protein
VDAGVSDWRDSKGYSHSETSKPVRRDELIE